LRPPAVPIKSAQAMRPLRIMGLATLSIVQFFFLVLVKDVKKDHTAVRNCFTLFTYIFQTPIGLSAQLAVIVDKTVFSAPHIFLEFATVGSVHLTISVIRFDQDTIDNAPDSFVACPIVLFDLL
jgi:hypothetical protein